MNFIKKTLFTLKTIMIVNGSWVKGILLMYELFQILRQQMKIGRNMFEKFGTDIIFAENMSQVNLFVKAGVKCESIVIVGNPVFDNAFAIVEPATPDPKTQKSIIC